MIRSQMNVHPTVRTPGGEYQLALKIYQGKSLIEVIPLGLQVLQGRERQFDLIEEIEPIETQFEGDIILIGYQAEDRIYHPGDEFTINLFGSRGP